MPRAPLTDAQKDVLRKRLADARAAKAAKPPQPRVARPAQLPPSDPTNAHALYAQWTETQWMNAPIEDCRSRLALLKVDFETGSRICGQRADVNDPHTYRCFVCKAAVAESKWAWKQDYLDHLTNLYKSVVICNQTCHTIYVNDTRMQQTLKRLMVGAPAEETAA